jgi:hypothetical protein
LLHPIARDSKPDLGQVLVSSHAAFDTLLYMIGLSCIRLRLCCISATRAAKSYCG